MFFSFLPTLIFNAIAIKVIDRSTIWKKHPVAIGVCFGLLAGMAHALRSASLDPQIFISMIDIPVMTAGFFYGTIPGLVAGGFAILCQLATLFWVQMDYWYVACLVSLLIAGFSVLTRKFFLEEQRPCLVPCILCMLFGEFLRHLIFCFISAFHENSMFHLAFQSQLLEIPGAVLAAILAVAAARTWGNWRANFWNRIILIFILFDLGCTGIFCASVSFARENANEVIDAGYFSMQKSFLDQVRYMLRDSAACYSDVEFNLRNCPHEDLQKLQKKTKFDEINIYNSNGKLANSNSSAVLNADRRLNFQPVQEGPLRKTPIMETGFEMDQLKDPNNVFRIVSPFSDGNGFLELGISEKTALSDYESMLIPLMKDRGFGKDGFFAVTDSAGKILIPVSRHPEMLGKNIFDFGISQADLANKNFENFIVFFDKQWCICYKFDGNSDKKTFAILPLWEIYSSYLALGCMSCLCLLTLLFLAQIVIVNIHNAWKKVETMRQEKNAMIQQDMEMARKIQMDELRHDNPVEKNMRMENFIQPAEAVGGDFYDFFHLRNGLKVNVIGDVSGEGIPAALFMMKVKTSIRENVRTSSTLVDAIAEVNQYLCRNNSTFMFVTLWICVFDAATGKGEYICAGHNPPLLLHSDREAEWLPKTNAVALGVSPRAKFVSRAMQLKGGDRLFLYTDGVTEAKNRLNEQFSPERLKRILENNTGSDVRKVYQEILNFTDGYPQSDDITMSEIHYYGTYAEIDEAEKQNQAAATNPQEKSSLVGQMFSRLMPRKSAL